jgi:adenylate cyclase
MKRCPECGREYDKTMMFCLDDGAELLYGPAKSEPGAVATGFLFDEPQTAILHSTAAPNDAPSRAQIHTTEQTAVFPHGAEAEPRESLGGLSKKQSFSARRATPLIAAVASVGLLVGGFFGYRYFSPTKQIESIAVMPFVNESGNADVEYLSDGMTETLISSLSQLPNLNVKPRSSVFRYKGRDSNPQTIGKELGVQALLNGRIVQRGQDVSLFVELIDIALDKVVWSQQYTRKQVDAVSLQSDIARDVSNKLKSKLSNTDVAKVEKNSKVDPEAYQLYLKGLFQLNRRTGSSLKQSEELFKQAIANDPKYAPAYVGLGQALSSFPYWSLAEPKDCLPQAKAAADRALELDDSVAGVHNLIGTYLQNYERDWAGAEREYKRVIELEPNDPDPYDSLGFLLSFLKRHDEAIAMERQALELDPLSKRGGLGLALIAAKLFDEAIAELKSAIALDPNYADTYYYLGIAYLGKGSSQDAIATWNKYVELDNEPVGRAFLAFAFAKAGNREKAVEELERLKRESSTRYVSGIAFALCHTALGNKAEALNWMEKDVNDRSSWASYYTIYPTFDDLRSEPRYKAMLERLNLPE